MNDDSDKIQLFTCKLNMWVTLKKFTDLFDIKAKKYRIILLEQMFSKGVILASLGIFSTLKKNILITKMK